MKADAYTSFLSSDKVTAYPTSKMLKPFRIASKTIRVVTPILLASLLTSCQSERKNSNLERVFQKLEIKSCLKAEDVLEDAEATILYQDVVNTYHLTPLQEKERLSQQEVLALMANPNAPELKDSNFNHSPENEANFWEIVRNGIQITLDVQNSKNLTDVQKKEYKITAFKMLSQITRSKTGDKDVDLTAYNNLKTFLYFEKVVKYGDNYEEVLSKEPGDIDERDEFFGRYYQDNQLLEQKAKDVPEVEEFAKALYASDRQFILSYNDSVQANEISRRILGSWMKKQQIRDINLWEYVPTTEDNDCWNNAVIRYYKRGETFVASLSVDPEGRIDNESYSPVGCILIHELQHVAQSSLTSEETPEDNHRLDDDNEIRLSRRRWDSGFISELGPTLFSLVLDDQIYKEIHHIDKDVVVDYGDFNLTNGRKVKLGELAVWFNKMMDKYPDNSVDKLIMRPEVWNKLSSLGKGAGFDLDFNQTVQKESSR